MGCIKTRKVTKFKKKKRNELVTGRTTKLSDSINKALVKVSSPTKTRFWIRSENKTRVRSSKVSVKMMIWIFLNNNNTSFMVMRTYQPRKHVIFLLWMKKNTNPVKEKEERWNIYGIRGENEGNGDDPFGRKSGEVKRTRLWFWEEKCSYSLIELPLSRFTVILSLSALFLLFS